MARKTAQQGRAKEAETAPNDDSDASEPRTQHNPKKTSVASPADANESVSLAEWFAVGDLVALSSGKMRLHDGPLQASLVDA